MCGISGIVSKKIFNPSDLKSINDLIVHRGPDDYGFSLWNVDIKKKKIPLLKKIIFKTILGLDTEGYQSWILVPMVVNQ